MYLELGIPATAAPWLIGWLALHLDQRCNSCESALNNEVSRPLVDSWGRSFVIFISNWLESPLESTLRWIMFVFERRIHSSLLASGLRKNLSYSIKKLKYQHEGIFILIPKISFIFRVHLYLVGNIFRWIHLYGCLLVCVNVAGMNRKSWYKFWWEVTEIRSWAHFSLSPNTATKGVKSCEGWWEHRYLFCLWIPLELTRN